MKTILAILALCACVALPSCAGVGPHGMAGALAKQKAGKARGATYDATTGRKTGEWSVENYDADSTVIASEAGKTARSYFYGQNAENIIPQVMKNPNIIPHNSNAIPRDPNATPPLAKDPNKAPDLALDPNAP